MTTSYFQDVVAWHRAVGHPVESELRRGFDDALGWRLVDEEFSELQNAYWSDFRTEDVADGIADLIWVLCGLAARHGINVDAVWEEVKRANFYKLTGPKREDGKILKPEGWRPPDIGKALKERIP